MHIIAHCKLIIPCSQWYPWAHFLFRGEPSPWRDLPHLFKLSWARRRLL